MTETSLVQHGPVRLNLKTIRGCLCAITASTLLLAVVSCDKASFPAPKPVPPLPSVATEAVPAPEMKSVQVERGKTLSAVAEKAYGHRDFAWFVAELNGLPDAQSVKAGEILLTPSLSVAFADVGVSPVDQLSINALAMAWTDYVALLPAYIIARETSAEKAGSFQIPPDMQQKLKAGADAITAAVDAIQKMAKASKQSPPSLSQFESAREALDVLAQGKIDGYDYDYDIVGQHAGRGFRDLLVWAKKNQGKSGK